MITSDIDFPDHLPCPLMEGYKRHNVSPFERTEMRNGRARNRRTFSAVPVEYDVNWMFYDDAQAGLFELWFKLKTKDGTEWFNTLMRTPQGYKKYVCRFVDMYDGPDIVGGTMWKVRARLEMWERPLIDEFWIEYPEMYAGMDIFDVAMNEKWPMHEHS